MYRLMQPSDEAAVLALWQSQHHDTEDFAKMVLERFAGVQNIYVADENDTIVAAALAVPVTLQGRVGNYLCLWRGQSAAGGSAGYPVRPAKAAGRRLYGGSPGRCSTGRAAAG